MAEEIIEETFEDEGAVIENEGESILDDPVAEELMANIKQGYREWEHDGKKYRTRFPVAKEENEARWVYAKTFNRALEEGLPTQKEMRKSLGI